LFQIGLWRKEGGKAQDPRPTVRRSGVQISNPKGHSNGDFSCARIGDFYVGKNVWKSEDRIRKFFGGAMDYGFSTMWDLLLCSTVATVVKKSWKSEDGSG
jgi:hypothetical protein